MLQLDLVYTVAFAGLVLFMGYGVRRLLPVLAKYNLPAPVIGGLIIAIIITLAKSQQVNLIQFDTTLQSPLMVAFFTTIGYGASLSLLRVGGPQVMKFLAIAVVFAILQNVVGVVAAVSFGLHPLLGVLTGAVALTGGPATALAFAPLFEQAGVTGATSAGVASAMGGIVMGGIIGGPIATWLIQRYGLIKTAKPTEIDTPVAAHVVEAHLPDGSAAVPEGEDKESYVLLKSLVIILVSMWAGSWISKGLATLGMTLPPYIGGMLVAAFLRNLDDKTRWLGLNQQTLDDIGNVALSLFIAMALMTLKLWEIAALALPLMVMLALQVLLIVIGCIYLIYRYMGQDYEAAVMSGGFCGFMLGTTANAMANMEALVERYGPAPRAFLVVPMVGAFFIDFINALITTFCLNFLG